MHAEAAVRASRCIIIAYVLSMENAGNAESEAEKERGDKTLYRSLIDQVILVGLDRHCRTCPDRHCTWKPI